ncbi:MAG: tRNA threonylcarbamoyladenosine biosynthesis protein TsaE [Saprospiraceae bacterium]|mgnify:CR=1 FL=1|jgi:tRNA threonylcarbamoyladenosine biosynthesis protein TsaE
MKLHIQNESEIDKLVDAFLLVSQGEKVTFLYGDLGAGKTTFVKRLVKKLGSTDEASSPTYSLVNEYDITDGILYHIDLYRLNDEQEALEIGIEDYLYSGHYCMVEWPQVIEKLINRAVEIKITTNQDESRSVEIDLVNY